jgi:Protein of unknown function (DUF4058)
MNLGNPWSGSMPSPFPGMDPYLERPRWFRGLHNGLIAYLQEAIQPLLPPPYFALTAELIWMEVSERSVDPDVDVLRRSHRRTRQAIEGGEEGGVATLVVEEVDEPVVVSVTEKRSGEERTEPYLEIYARRDGEDRLVTSIEILSPSNKRLGSEGREKYMEKQREILDGDVNLVEIDLLRGGAHISAVPRVLAEENAGPFDYHVSIRRFDRCGEFLVYPILLSRRLPTIRIPLLPGDPDVPLSLQSVFQRAYDAGPYRRAVRYGEDTIDPPLLPDQATWAGQVLSAAVVPKSSV